MVKNEEMTEWKRILVSKKPGSMTEEDVFDDVAFNGLVDGAGEFPLWEKDSHK